MLKWTWFAFSFIQLEKAFKYGKEINVYSWLWRPVVVESDDEFMNRPTVSLYCWYAENRNPKHLLWDFLNSFLQLEHHGIKSGLVQTNEERATGNGLKIYVLCGIKEHKNLFASLSSIVFASYHAFIICQTDFVENFPRIVLSSSQLSFDDFLCKR